MCVCVCVCVCLMKIRKSENPKYHDDVILYAVVYNCNNCNNSNMFECLQLLQRVACKLHMKPRY